MLQYVWHLCFISTCMLKMMIWCIPFVLAMQEKLSLLWITFGWGCRRQQRILRHCCCFQEVRRGRRQGQGVRVFPTGLWPRQQSGLGLRTFVNGPSQRSMQEIALRIFCFHYAGTINLINLAHSFLWWSCYNHAFLTMDRFFELTGHYPEQITVVSYNLKQNRFSTLHRGAIRFPSEKFKFVGTPVSHRRCSTTAVPPMKLLPGMVVCDTY